MCALHFSRVCLMICWDKRRYTIHSKKFFEILIDFKKDGLFFVRKNFWLEFSCLAFIARLYLRKNKAIPIIAKKILGNYYLLFRNPNYLWITQKGRLFSSKAYLRDYFLWWVDLSVFNL